MGPGSIEAMEAAWQADDPAVSAFTFWEVAMLRAKDRLDSPKDVAAWRRELLGQGLIEIPVDGDIGIRANVLGRIFTPTPQTASSSPRHGTASATAW